MDDQEDKGCPLIVCFFTEFFGTAVLMYVGCMGCLDKMGLGPVLPSFTFGIAIQSAVQMFSHITPVHINPAVSVGSVILGKMNWKQFLVYLVGQYSGALVGFALLKITLYEHPNLCLLKINDKLSVAQGFFLEYFVTLVLLLVVAGAVDIKNENHHDSTSLRLGMVIVGLVFGLEPFTGAGLNPARSLPPCIFYRNWENHWVYHLAPYCGMATAAIFYRFLFDEQQKYSLPGIINRRF